MSYSLVFIPAPDVNHDCHHERDRITLIRVHVCVRSEPQCFISNLCSTHFQDDSFVSDYVSMFPIMSSHFSEVPLKNGPFPLLTIFVEVVVKFVNWGHFKVLTGMNSRYSMPCGEIWAREVSSLCQDLIQRKQNSPLP